MCNMTDLNHELAIYQHKKIVLARENVSYSKEDNFDEVNFRDNRWADKEEMLLDPLYYSVITDWLVTCRGMQDKANGLERN